MGGFAARKVLSVLENVEKVIAIELVCAAQALEFRRPLKTTAPLEAVFALLRTKVPFWQKDEYAAPAIEEARQLVTTGEVLRVVQELLPAEFAL
jgi:histidine ammonia-lyase